MINTSVISNIKISILNPRSPIVNPGRTSSNPYRPAQWSKGTQDIEQLIYMRANILDDASATDYAPATAYFFDAIIRMEHTSSLRITEHPVQTGANISDHAYLLPAHLVLEIGMSDAMDTFIKGQFSDNPSKSVSTLQTLKRLQARRTTLTVTTRLNTYKNMLIEQIVAPDDFKTSTSLKCSVIMKEIITADVSVVSVSASPNVTGSTNKGPVQATTLTPQQTTVARQILQGAGVER